MQNFGNNIEETAVVKVSYVYGINKKQVQLSISFRYKNTLTIHIYVHNIKNGSRKLIVDCYKFSLLCLFIFVFYVIVNVVFIKHYISYED